jgi:hypothetical protein
MEFLSGFVVRVLVVASEAVSMATDDWDNDKAIRVSTAKS